MPYVSLNHLDLFYEDTQKGDDLPLLFLHGWGTSGRVWGAQLPAFRDGIALSVSTGAGVDVPTGRLPATT